MHVVRHHDERVEAHVPVMRREIAPRTQNDFAQRAQTHLAPVVDASKHRHPPGRAGGDEVRARRAVIERTQAERVGAEGHWREGASQAHPRAVRNLLALTVLLLAATAHAQPRVLDSFGSIAAWEVVTADGVELAISEDDGALRMDYNFKSGGGYAIARRAVDLTLPEDYRFAWRLRAERFGGGPAPVNDLEFKLVDPTGDNVWWHNRRRFAYPSEWTTLVSRARHVPFAWGPVGGGPPGRIAFVEFTVTAIEGGRGSVWIDDFTYEPVARTAGSPPEPRVTASAGDAAGVLAGTRPWTAAPGERTLTLDFGAARELGGLTLGWAPDRHAADYAVDVSSDGRRWEPRYSATDAAGGAHLVPLSDTEARYLRLRLGRAAGASGYRLDRLTVEPFAFAESPNVFAFRRARLAPRGRFPRPLTDSVQTFWTIVGLPNDDDEALVSEDGTVDVGRAFSLEPFLLSGGRTLSWADGAHAQTLTDGDLPLPRVTRTHAADSLALTVRAWAHAADGAPLLVVEYGVENRARGGGARRVPLAVGLRPVQVNPPWQFLNLAGGVGRVESIARGGAAGSLVVNAGEMPGGGPRTPAFLVGPSVRPDALAAVGYAGGDALDRVLAGSGTGSPADTLRDALGLGSAAWRFDLTLAPGETRAVRFYVPLREGARPAAERALAGGTAVDAEATRAVWRGLVGRVRLSVPDSELVQTVRANLAYVLLNADGPRIQPGSRAYERSWIRDGSLTSAALLRLGLFAEARAFVEWYARYQYPNGRVPCCVDLRGADPTPEHDSHGQLIYAIADYTRITGDTAFARRMWPHAARAVQALDDLRALRSTAAYTDPPPGADSMRAYAGMLPESISHEGYSVKPMHSYWDGLFGLKGYKDAAYLAARLGRPDSAAYGARADTFRAVLERSFRRAMAKEGIDYLPGSVELGDFDATSTTVFISPGSETRFMPDAMARTFDRYWRFFETRRDSGNWDGYTPYEWRTAGTMLRLGEPERAWAIFDWFFGHRRPAGWRHWAEVVWKDPQTPRFIGDMPHTWVGSDFLRSALDLFGFEDEAAGALVVGAGLKRAWLDAPEGVRIGGLQTWYGPLGYAARRADGRVTVAFSERPSPPGGVVLRIPGRFRTATADGRAVALSPDGSLRLPSVPAEIVLAE